ncbi:MAG: 2-hydroxyacid dehydrogenase [Chitinophagaceae bacterium]|nr:2-hydroxyacid dehydrogenase [Chitinophagaceae bacterium]
MQVAFFSTHSYDKEYFDRLNDEKLHQITYFEAPLNRDTANLTKGFDAICIFVNDKLDSETIEKIFINGVKLVVLRCAGFNNVDLNAVAGRNMKVLRVPSYSPQAVAEHAVALILTLNRKTHKAYNRIRESNFSLEKLVGFNLSGKTVGVIGTGQIGIMFCNIMMGFGCRIVAHDLYESDELKEKGIVYKPLPELLHESDIISLHCPLTPETMHLISKNAIDQMKKGVMLINTSRGAVINTPDVIEALADEKIGYLGIDVYEQEANLFFRDLSESIIRDDVITRLLTFPNVLITAHQGFFTKEALEEITMTTLQNLSDFENGVKSLNEVEIK